MTATQEMQREEYAPPVKDKRPPLSPLRRRLMGLGLVLVMLLVVALCLANFNKLFKPVDTVYLKTSTVGNQLSKQCDAVKVAPLQVVYEEYQWSFLCQSPEHLAQCSKSTTPQFS